MNKHLLSTTQILALAFLNLTTAQAPAATGDFAQELGISADYQLLEVSTFHEGEISPTPGKGWYALVSQDKASKLQEVAIRIKNVPDVILEEKGPGGSALSVSTQPEFKGRVITLIRPPAKASWNAGPVVDITPVAKAESGERTLTPGEAFSFSLGQATYVLSATASKSEKIGDSEEKTYTGYKITLTQGRLSQVIFEGTSREYKSLSTGQLPSITWVGDLDRDNKPDLLLDLTWHYNLSRLTLFLSSPASGQDMVTPVATVDQTGC